MNTLNSKPSKTFSQRLIFAGLACALIGQAYWLPKLWESATVSPNSAVASVFLGLGLLSIVGVCSGIMCGMEALKKSWL